MKTLLTIVAFATLAGFLYILGSTVPRTDLIVVIGAMLALAFWDLFVHDRMRMRKARLSDPRDMPGHAHGHDATLAPELTTPGTVRDDGRPVEGLER